MNRFTIRLLLGVTFAAAILVAATAYISGGSNSWATVAAALAVVTSVVSSWSAQRIFEQQEDTQKPFVIPTIDNKSKVGLFLFRVKNFGGSPAYDIYIDWNTPLLNHDNKPVRFNQHNKGGPEISVLLPKESVATFLNVDFQFYQQHGYDTNYTGTIRFKDTTGKDFKQPFIVNAGQLADTQAIDNEETEAFSKLKQVPDSIDKLTEELIKLRRSLPKVEDRTKASS